MEDYIDSERFQEYLDEKDIVGADDADYLSGIDGLDALSEPVREAGDTAYMLRMYANYADQLVEDYLDSEDPEEMEEVREEITDVLTGPVAELMEEFGETYREAADEVLGYDEMDEEDETALRELARYHSRTVETLSGSEVYDDVTETALREFMDQTLEQAVDDPIYGPSTEELVSSVIGEPYDPSQSVYDPAELAGEDVDIDMDVLQEYAGEISPEAVGDMYDTDDGDVAY